MFLHIFYIYSPLVRKVCVSLRNSRSGVRVDFKAACVCSDGSYGGTMYGGGGGRFIRITLPRHEAPL